MRDTSDVLANLAVPLESRPNRRILRIIVSITILLLLVFLGPFAVKRAVQWAVADLGISGDAGVNGTNGVNGLDGANGVAGPQGLAGKMGMTGPAGATGAEGAQGIPGEVGATGAQGEPGATGPQGPAGDTTPISIGQGSGQTAACDSDISVSMRSRWDGHRLVLGSIEFSRVSESCNGQRLSVFLIDFADELITSVVVESATVTSGNIRLAHSTYSEFDEIPSSDIHQVIIEMAS
ncbi:MAG: hypothetical protein RLZZ319_397 [Actinomycetota bacterium]|jgi:hypothetical protein